MKKRVISGEKNKPGTPGVFFILLLAASTRKEIGQE
jgi:hypothetical protein